MATTRIRSGKRPANWQEFYKNGPPQEVIIIDDDSPPPSSSSTASSTASAQYRQVPSRRHYQHNNYDHPLSLGSSPRSHVMPPPPNMSHLPPYGQHDPGYHHSHHYQLYPDSGPLPPSHPDHPGRMTKRSNKRYPSTDLAPYGSNGSTSYPSPNSTSHHRFNSSSGNQYPSYSGGPDPHHYAYSNGSYASTIHPAPHHAYPYHHHSNYSNIIDPTTESLSVELIAPVRKKRRSNATEVKYIAPPQHPPAIPEKAPYASYYNPPPNHAPKVITKDQAAFGRDAPAAIPPWDDKEGHYIVVPGEDLTSRYKMIRLLGQGTFGKVVECFDRDTGKHCAIKIIRAVQKYRDASKIEARVLNTLKKSDPRNSYKCLHLNEIFDYRNHVCMVFNLLGQSIYDWLKDNSFCPFPPNQIQQFARQLLTSVAFLHRLRLIHTDLKPENILLANGNFRTEPYKKSPTNTRRVLLDPDIRLIDFGSATFQDEHHSTVVSTRHYRAPEIILGMGWSYPCDIWSVGCILVEFLTGEALFQTHDNLEHLAMMQAVLGPIPEKLIRASQRAQQKFFIHGRLDYPNDETKRNSRKYVRALRPLRDYVVPAGNRSENVSFASEFMDLLSQLLAYDSDHRISAVDALRHPYFNYVVDESGFILDVKKPCN
ncbi:dual specificity protein kinase kns1 [Linnemannia gamsii]|uniref:Dual specificity protein kinase kns1 n=1 Tax=Linnemannia gamsii TaxID=64522 RepID=A0A9P6QXK9_9FUNG|nr:dual specificity protein kinase kns1 [Linnemannia gamsii]